MYIGKINDLSYIKHFFHVLHFVVIGSYRLITIKYSKATTKNKAKNINQSSFAAFTFQGNLFKKKKSPEVVALSSAFSKTLFLIYLFPTFFEKKKKPFFFQSLNDYHESPLTFSLYS